MVRLPARRPASARAGGSAAVRNRQVCQPVAPVQVGRYPLVALPPPERPLHRQETAAYSIRHHKKEKNTRRRIHDSGLGHEFLVDAQLRRERNQTPAQAQNPANGALGQSSRSHYSELGYLPAASGEAPPRLSASARNGDTLRKRGSQNSRGCCWVGRRA